MQALKINSSPSPPVILLEYICDSESRTDFICSIKTSEHADQLRCHSHHQVPPLCHRIGSPNLAFVKRNAFLTGTLLKYRAGRHTLTSHLFLRQLLSYQIQSGEGEVQPWKGSPEDLGCWQGLPHRCDALGTRRDYRSERAVWPGCGSGEHILGWREVASYLKREGHPKVLNCKAESLTQSLNFGVPIIYDTTLGPCSCCSLSCVVNQQATNQCFDSVTHQTDKSMY